MPFYVFAWVASFMFGLVGIIGKLTSKYSISNPWLFNFLWTLLSLLLILPIALINKVGIPTHWGSLFLVALFNLLFNVFYILGISLLDVSVMVPLLNIRTAFVAIIGELFLGEVFNSFQYFLIALIFSAGLFVSIDEKYSIKSFFRWPIFIAILCTLSYTLMGVFTKPSIAENGYWEVTLWSPVLSQLMLLVTVPLFKNDIKKINFKQLGVVFSMSLALAAGVILENRAYKENVTITNIITALPISLVLVFLFSIFAPKLLEKHSFKIYAIRFTAATVMIISALKLST